MKEKLQYTFGLIGSTNFMEAAIEPMETLDQFLKNDGWEESDEFVKGNPVINPQYRPRALSGLEVIGGLLIFTCTCFGKKIFDEFYERLLKRPVGTCIDSLLVKCSFGKKKQIEFRDIVFYENIDLTVIIRVFVDKSNAPIIEKQLLEAHRLAFAYVLKEGRQAPIHCHCVVDNKIDSIPELYDSMKQIQQHDKNSN